MKRFPILAALALLSTASVAGGQVPAAATSATRPAARDFPAVRAFADELVRAGNVPGIAIAIGIGDDAPQWITAGRTSFDGSVATTPDTLWRIYSMTKPITGIAAMILVDDGKLRLDQPVGDILPAYASAKVLIDPAHGTETRPATRSITIRDLMTHSSGLNYAITANSPAQRALQAAGIVPFQINPVMEARMRPLRPATLQQFAARAGQFPLVAEPESAWNYSMGLDVLAAVVEKVSGMSYEAFVQRRILKPLGMTSTQWQVKRSQVGRFTANYGPRALVEPTWPGSTTPVDDTLAVIDRPDTSVYLKAPSFPYGGAGLVSTARDYDRFLHMLLNDGRLGNTRVLTAASARLAKSNLLPAGLTVTNFGPIPPNEPVGFGAGGFVTLKDVDGFGRSKGTYGWDGAAGTRAWVDPVRRVRATMMINLLGATEIGNAFDRALTTDLNARTTAPAGP